MTPIHIDPLELSQDLVSMSLVQLSAKYKVSKITVSRWRKQFHINLGKTGRPSKYTFGSPSPPSPPSPPSVPAESRSEFGTLADLAEMNKKIDEINAQYATMSIDELLEIYHGQKK